MYKKCNSYKEQADHVNRVADKCYEIRCKLPYQLEDVRHQTMNNIEKLSKTISDRWSKLNYNVYHRTGKLLEKYNVEDISLLSGGGEYEVQDGFGWTNGVLMKINQ